MSPANSTIGTEFSDALQKALQTLNEPADKGLEAGHWCAAQWQCFEDLGATSLLCVDGEENTATSLEDFMTVASRLGQLQIPFAGVESIVAGWLIKSLTDQGDSSDLPTSGMMGIGIAPFRDQQPPGDRQANGEIDFVRAVPWGRYCNRVFVIEPEVDAQQNLHEQPTNVAILDRQKCRTELRENIALESRDDLYVSDTTGTTKRYRIDTPFSTLLQLLALGRSAQMVGVMQEIVRITVSYVSERQQFGRPLSRFQAIQHNLATMYAETMAATVATRAALRGEITEISTFDSAAAIIRCREAATKVAALAHQAHGAMGFTDDYVLAGYTRRLWAWRDEYQSEQWWQQQLGRIALNSDKTLLEQLTSASG